MLTPKQRRARRAKRRGRRKLSWRARHRPGGIYCAPACGCGCRYSEYRAAHARGRQMAEIARRSFKGWRVHVWENGGWHYSLKRVVSGRVVAEVHDSGWKCAIKTPSRFWCDMNVAGQQYTGEGRTVADAYRDARAKAVTHAANISREVSDL